MDELPPGPPAPPGRSTWRWPSVDEVADVAGAALVPALVVAERRPATQRRRHRPDRSGRRGIPIPRWDAPSSPVAPSAKRTDVLAAVKGPDPDLVAQTVRLGSERKPPSDTRVLYLGTGIRRSMTLTVGLFSKLPEGEYSRRRRVGLSTSIRAAADPHDGGLVRQAVGHVDRRGQVHRRGVVDDDVGSRPDEVQSRATTTTSTVITEASTSTRRLVDPRPVDAG